MNLVKMFDMQKEFDQKVVENKGLEGQRLFAKKKLALRTELGELANELPSIFKFWSNKTDNREKALVEYVDGLHFVLSLIIECAGDYITDILSEVTEQELRHPLIAFERTYRAIQFAYPSGDYDCFIVLLNRYLDLGLSLGFTETEVEETYLYKNGINHQRQESGVY